MVQIELTAEAVTLYKILKDYGKSITTINQAGQTAQLQKIFTELDNPENSQRIEAIGWKMRQFRKNNLI